MIDGVHGHGVQRYTAPGYGAFQGSNAPVMKTAFAPGAPKPTFVTYRVGTWITRTSFFASLTTSTRPDPFCAM